MLTGRRRRGAWTRHASTGGVATAAGIKADCGPLRSAVESEIEKMAAEGTELSESDAAQQLSACAWVTAPGSVDPCIGQPPLPEQQSMRASGAACHPAHSAHPAVPSVRARTSAAARLKSRCTPLGCTGAAQESMLTTRSAGSPFWIDGSAGGITVRLAQIGDPGADANLGAMPAGASSAKSSARLDVFQNVPDGRRAASRRAVSGGGRREWPPLGVASR